MEDRPIYHELLSPKPDRLQELELEMLRRNPIVGSIFYDGVDRGVYFLQQSPHPFCGSQCRCLRRASGLNIPVRRVRICLRHRDGLFRPSQ
jgi:hypothetical protein